MNTLYVAPFDAVHVGSRNGIVEKVFVKLGQNVKKGDPLVELISPELAEAKGPLQTRWTCSAPFDGTVIQIGANPGELYNHSGGPLIVIKLANPDEPDAKQTDRPKKGFRVPGTNVECRGFTGQ